jgi:hypothetical protein
MSVFDRMEDMTPQSNGSYKSNNGRIVWKSWDDYQKSIHPLISNKNGKRNK